MATRSSRKSGSDRLDRQDPALLAAEIERLQARLDEAEQRNRDFLEGSLQGVMVHRDNRLIFVNQAFADIFGYPDASAMLAVGDWKHHLAPSEWQRLEDYRAARMRGGAAPARYIFEGRRKDGTPVWVENVVRLVKWDGVPAILCSMLDVSNRRQMEIDLRLSEERFRTAFEGAPLGVAVGMPGKGFIQVNDEYCRFLNRTREELINHPDPLSLVREVTHPDDIEADLAQFSRLLDGSIDNYQLEKRFVLPGGEIRWGHLAVSGSRDSAGTIRYVIAHLIDITERKKAEAALRESEERFRVAFEQSPLGLALGNPSQGWRQTNRAFIDFLGLTPDDPVFKLDLATQLRAYSNPEDSTEHLRLHNELVAGVRDSFQLEKRYRTPDGRTRWGSLHVAATRNADGSIKWLISQRLDITAQKEAEQALRESEERFRAAFEYAPVALAVAEYNSEGLQANAAMCEFLGRPKEWFAASRDHFQSIRDTSHPDDLPAEFAALEVLRKGGANHYSSERRFVRPSGEVRWGSGTISVTRGPDGRVRYVIAQITDITERKLAEEALRESEERFRATFEQAPVGLAIWEYNRGGVQANAALCNFLGWPKEWFLANRDRMSLINLVTHPDDCSAGLAGFDRVRKGEIDAFRMEMRYRHATGKTIWGDASFTATRWPDKRVRYVILQVTDITPRREIEAALKRSEERFRVAFERAPVGMNLALPNGPYIQVNRAFAEFVGRTPEAILCLDNYKQGIQELTHPEDLAVTLEGIGKLLRGEVETFQLEKRYRTPEGDVRWGVMSATLARTPEGVPDYLITQVVDITPRKQAEEALRESEERFRIAFEYAPLGISVAVPGRGWVQMNDAMERFLGRPRAALMGRPDQLEMIQEISHPDDFPANAVLFNRMIAGDIDHYQMEKRYLLPSGESRWGFLNVAASRGPDGAIRYTVTQVADITALKQTEQALRDREATLAAAQRITHLGSWRIEFADSRFGRDGTLQWSDEVFRILGHEPGDFSPSFDKLREHTHPDDRSRVHETWERAVEQRTPYIVEHRIIRPDGAERLVTQQAEIIYDPRTAKPVLARGTIQDMTEQKELERKLLQSQKLESLGLLAGGIAHDFNNLLTGILGYSSLARQALVPESPLHEFVTQIEIGGRRAAELCQQMLAYAGRGRFEVRACAINNIVLDTVPLLEVSIHKKISITLNLAEALPAVEVDATQIRQIVMNLITNASDAIGARDGRIIVTTGVVHADLDYLSRTYLAPAIPEGRYVYLEVSDTGEGMTPEVQKKIFDPFFTTKFAGRGLGLAAVLGIVRAHHGALKVYSEPGRGTTMRLLLPAVAASANLAVAAEAAPWRGQGLALVADDEPTVREVAVRMLETLGFTTIPVSNGREAVEVFRTKGHSVRLVLLDLTMPHMDGEEAFRAIRAINSSATVVLMSGFTEQESLDRFAGTGLAAFVQKPFSLESLKEVLQRVAP